MGNPAPLFRPGRIVILIVATAFLPVAAAAESALSVCRRITDDTARLVCYDAIDEPAGAASNSASAGAAPVQSPPSPANPPAASDTADRIHARVANTRLRADGKLVVTLDNGQIWTQTDSSKLRIREGDEVRIRRAMFSSYLLSRIKGGIAIRVRRSE